MVTPKIKTRCEPLIDLEGISFKDDKFSWILDDCTVKPGEWVCFSPEADDVYPDASLTLARTISSLEFNLSGKLKIFGQNISNLSYDQRLVLRRKIGYIQCSGAILANRTLLENIRYPLDFYRNAKKNNKDTNQEILQLMVIMGISPYADYLVHNVDEIVRWRTCLCRALITQPDLLIFEGIGDWTYSQGKRFVWHYLKNTVKKKNQAVAFSLPKKNPLFEKWVECMGGKIVKYRLQKAVRWI